MNSIQHWINIPCICAVDDTQLSCEMTNKDWPQYVYGLEEPNYPVPATLDNGETASNYLMLRCMVGPNRLPCTVCIDRFNDQIDFDQSWFTTNREIH